MPGVKLLVDSGAKIEASKYSHLDDYSTRLSLQDGKFGGPISLRPSKECTVPEAGYLWTAIQSFGLKLPEPEIQALKTLKIGHLLDEKCSRYKVGEVSQEDVIHSIVKNSFKTLRRILENDTRKRLILPGRDVWLWEVMARKKNVPTLFDARVSRLLKDHASFKQVVEGWKIDQHTIIFDTGFAGSIYEAICRAAGVRCHSLMLSTERVNGQGQKEQLYPNHKGSRSKALAIEYLPKYQCSGTIRDGAPVQYLAPLLEFIRTAILTIWFWHHQSPKWVDQGKPKCKASECPGCRSCALWRKGVQVAEDPKPKTKVSDYSVWSSTSTAITKLKLGGDSTNFF